MLKFLEAEKVMNKKLISYVLEIKMYGAWGIERNRKF